METDSLVPGDYEFLQRQFELHTTPPKGHSNIQTPNASRDYARLHVEDYNESTPAHLSYVEHDERYQSLKQPEHMSDHDAFGTSNRLESFRLADMGSTKAGAPMRTQ
jgi:hypothetical protein